MLLCLLQYIMVLCLLQYIMVLEESVVWHRKLAAKLADQPLSQYKANQVRRRIAQEFEHIATATATTRIKNTQAQISLKAHTRPSELA